MSGACILAVILQEAWDLIQTAPNCLVQVSFSHEPQSSQENDGISTGPPPSTVAPRPENKMLCLHETLSESLYQVNCVFAPSLRYLCNLLPSLPPPVMMSYMNRPFKGNAVMHWWPVSIIVIQNKDDRSNEKLSVKIVFLITLLGCLIPLSWGQNQDFLHSVSHFNLHQFPSPEKVQILLTSSYN